MRVRRLDRNRASTVRRLKTQASVRAIPVPGPIGPFGKRNRISSAKLLLAGALVIVTAPRNRLDARVSSETIACELLLSFATMICLSAASRHRPTVEQSMRGWGLDSDKAALRAELEAAMANYRGPVKQYPAAPAPELVFGEERVPLMMRTRPTRIFCPDCVSGYALSTPRNRAGCIPRRARVARL